jgi:hypothetical protein
MADRRTLRHPQLGDTLHLVAALQGYCFSTLYNNASLSSYLSTGFLAEADAHTRWRIQMGVTIISRLIHQGRREVQFCSWKFRFDTA